MSTDEIMLEITKASYMDSIVNNIVTNEHAQFKEQLVQKLMNTVVPEVAAKARTNLNTACISEILYIQQEQEQMNDNLNQKFNIMRQTGKDTGNSADKISSQHNNFLEKTESSCLQLNSLKHNISSIESEIRVTQLANDTNKQTDVISDANKSANKIKQTIGQAKTGITNVEQHLK